MTIRGFGLYHYTSCNGWRAPGALRVCIVPAANQALLCCHNVLIHTWIEGGFMWVWRYSSLILSLCGLLSSFSFLKNRPGIICNYVASFARIFLGQERDWMLDFWTQWYWQPLDGPAHSLLKWCWNIFLLMLRCFLCEVCLLDFSVAFFLSTSHVTPLTSAQR